MMGRIITIAINAVVLVMHLPRKKDTCLFTAERSPLFVHSATSLAQQLALLEPTCELIQEKSLIIANSVTFPAHKVVASNST